MTPETGKLTEDSAEAVALPEAEWLYSVCAAARARQWPSCRPSWATFFLGLPSALTAIAETVEVDPADGSRVLCHCHWQPETARAQQPTLVLVHGLEGSSDSRYMQGIAARAWAAGCNVVRMNMRNCGDTDALTPTLYHSGLSGDVGAVVSILPQRFGLERVALVGYSMGGNLVLKLAGEWGTRAACAPWRRSARPSISLPVRRVARAGEPVYEWRFLRGLMARFRRKAALFPQIYDASMASGRCVHCANLTIRSWRATAAFAMLTTTTTAPPAHA